MKIHSSNLDEAFYSHKSKWLTIVFKNGSTYIYFNFSEEKWNEFKKAESKGNWFYYNVRNGGYEFKKLEAMEKKEAA